MFNIATKCQFKLNNIIQKSKRYSMKNFKNCLKFKLQIPPKTYCTLICKVTTQKNITRDINMNESQNTF